MSKKPKPANQSQFDCYMRATVGLPSPFDVTKEDLDELQHYIQKRHLDTCVDAHGRAITHRDTIWANLYRDAVQEIVVAYLRIKRKQITDADAQLRQPPASAVFTLEHAKLPRKRKGPDVYTAAAAATATRRQEVSFRRGAKHAMLGLGYGTTAKRKGKSKP